MSELKLCPFCGKEAEYSKRYKYVFCKCIVGSEQMPNDFSVEHWNTRPLEEALKKQLEQLMDQLVD